MMTYELVCERLKEFGPVFAEAYCNNQVVHAIMQGYANGSIITKEEALSRMVLELFEQNKRLSPQYYYSAPPNNFPDSSESGINNKQQTMAGNPTALIK